MQTVILAYSGGLVNTVAIHWLRTRKRMRVITFSAELGQDDDLEALAETALLNGAEAAHIADLRESFLTDFVFPTLRSGAMYEGSYMLSTALSRPLIALEMVRLAREEGCEILAHGAPGRSNDQVRFETAISALAPDLRMIGPRREWQFETIDQIESYANRYNIRVSDEELHARYTRDQNIWGARVAGGELEDPSVPPPEDVYTLTRDPAGSLAVPDDIEIRFEEGVPVGLDGEAVDPVPLVRRLNHIGGEHGIGRIDHLENRLFGTKVREVYEKPAAAICYTALRALEKLTMSARALHVKPRLSDEFAELLYQGHWFSDLREGLSAFFSHLMRHVTGTVRLRLYRGMVTLLGVESPFSLYQREVSTMDRAESSDMQAVTGWLQLASSVERHASRVRRDQSGRVRRAGPE